MNMMGTENRNQTGVAPGFVIGTVVSNVDLEGRGRVRVKLDTLGPTVVTAPAPTVTPNANYTFLPEIGEQVVVGFFNGDLNDPFVVGSVQNGIKPAPFPNNAAGNNFKVIQTRLGHTIIFDDTPGAGKIVIADVSKTNSIVIDMATSQISITSGGSIALTAGGDITMQATNITMQAAAEVTVDAGANAAVSAGAQLSVEAGASASVQAGGTLEIKGATINLN